MRFFLIALLFAHAGSAAPTFKAGKTFPLNKVCEKTNDGCNICTRMCGDDGWSCTSIYCPSKKAQCERQAMMDNKNPKDCMKVKKKP